MVRRMQFPSRWSLMDEVGNDLHASLGPSHVVSPSIPRAALTSLLAGLIPNRNHNDALGRLLQRLPRGRAASQPIFAVFAADPFFKGKRIAQQLREKRYERVVNWPTTAQYGSEFCQALNGVNLGPQQEYRNLLQLAEQGLSVSLAVCGAEAAVEVARLKPQVVFLTPSFDLWANGKLRSSELLRRCAALARVVQKEAPIVLMAPRRSLSLSQVRRAGADALLLV